MCRSLNNAIVISFRSSGLSYQGPHSQPLDLAPDIQSCEDVARAIVLITQRAMSRTYYSRSYGAACGVHAHIKPGPPPNNKITLHNGAKAGQHSWQSMRYSSYMTSYMRSWW